VGRVAVALEAVVPAAEDQVEEDRAEEWVVGRVGAGRGPAEVPRGERVPLAEPEVPAAHGSLPAPLWFLPAA
jgi:hypothetical protein